jgi:hypothetical protein
MADFDFNPVFVLRENVICHFQEKLNKLKKIENLRNQEILFEIFCSEFSKITLIELRLIVLFRARIFSF